MSAGVCFRGSSLKRLPVLLLLATVKVGSSTNRTGERDRHFVYHALVDVPSGLSE